MGGDDRELSCEEIEECALELGEKVNGNRHSRIGELTGGRSACVSGSTPDFEGETLTEKCSIIYNFLNFVPALPDKTIVKSVKLSPYASSYSLFNSHLENPLLSSHIFSISI